MNGVNIVIGDDNMIGLIAQDHNKIVNVLNGERRFYLKGHNLVVNTKVYSRRITRKLLDEDEVSENDIKELVDNDDLIKYIKTELILETERRLRYFGKEIKE